VNVHEYRIFLFRLLVYTASYFAILFKSLAAESPSNGLNADRLILDELTVNEARSVRLGSMISASVTSGCKQHDQKPNGWTRNDLESSAELYRASSTPSSNQLITTTTNAENDKVTSNSMSLFSRYSIMPFPVLRFEAPRKHIAPVVPTTPNKTKAWTAYAPINNRLLRGSTGMRFKVSYNKKEEGENDNVILW